ncbi:unnamed protein product, partial [Musa textilis]
LAGKRASPAPCGHAAGHQRKQPTGAACLRPAARRPTATMYMAMAASSLGRDCSASTVRAATIATLPRLLCQRF